MVTTLKLDDFEDKNFDPFALDKMANGDTDDPYPRIHELHEQGNVIKGSYRAEFSDVPDATLGHFEHHMVLGHDAVMEVFSKPEIFTNRGVFEHSIGKSFGRSITAMDPPEHPRFRKVFQKAFLPQVVAKWGESVVDPVVNRLMAQFKSTGRADLIQQFTLLYPFQVIYSQLELAPEQGPIFQKLAVAQLLVSVNIPQGQEATRKLGDFFKALLEERRADPGDDLVSHLATVEAEGERLPDDVIVAFLRQLVNAGGDTTYRGTSILLTCLLNNPDQLAAVIEDRSLLPRAIDEALRWDCPVTRTFRYVSEDTELDGVFLKKNSVVDVVVGSANRDPSKFEDPDRFNIFRKLEHQTIPFASGPHVCIGQHLARLEMRRAMDALLDHLPKLRLDPDMPAPDIRGFFLRTPEHLYVAFD